MPTFTTSGGKSASTAAKKPVDEIVQEIAKGLWGTGAERKLKLEAAGYDSALIERAVERAGLNKTPAAAPVQKKSVDVIVDEVVSGLWGNGADRKAKLEAAGYDYSLVQRAVDRKLGAGAASLDAVAAAVIRGEYGNGADRKAKLEAAGYNYDQVQAAVNQKLAGGAPAGNLDDVAKAVIRGEYGNGADRRAKLEAAGYNFDQVQARVNQLLK